MNINLAFISKLLALLLSIYLLYALLVAILSYAFQKPVSSAHKAQFAALDFSARHSLDRVALIETPEDAFRYRIQLLQQAKHSIDIAYFTIGAGVTSERFFGEVFRAAGRGVKIRFLVDGKMGGMFDSHSPIGYALAIHPNIEYKIYNPLEIFSPWKWNSLLHDKFIIIDNTFLLLGGRNIGDIYLNPPDYTGRLSLDRDIFVFNTGFDTKISHDSVITAVTAYMDDLMSCDAAKPAFRVLSATKRAYGTSTQNRLLSQMNAFQKENPALYSLPTMNDYRHITVPTQGITLLNNPIHPNGKEPLVAYGLAQLALDAKESVLIQTPYATANKKLLEVMSQLGAKDIAFEMLTNSMGSTPNPPAFSNYYYNRKKFLQTGVTLYEFQQRKGIPRGSIHAKSYLFDNDLSAVGTLNLDDRSLYISTETMLIINSPEFNTLLRGTIQDWQADSLVVGNNNQYLPDQTVPEKKTSIPKHIMMFVVSLLSRLFQYLI